MFELNELPLLSPFVSFSVFRFQSSLFVIVFFMYISNQVCIPVLLHV